ncbi:MAG: hypothetical protein ABSF90_10520 [Syntrophobacteraceae bacterium]|jgi:hypothetical protein
MNAKKPTVAMPPALMPGDLFVAECGSLLGRTISGVEKWKDAEGDPQWSHAGIIVSEAGETFEALWTIRNGDMSAYAGLRVMIARYKKMDRQRFRDAYKAVAKAHRNEIYPLWRLPLFFLGLARFVHWGVVCSELQAEFNHCACREDGIFEFDNWHGYDPAMLADIYERWGDFEVIYKGVWR